MSLSDFLLKIVRRAAERATPEDMRARLAETLDAPLLTRERTLAAVPDCDARVKVV